MKFFLTLIALVSFASFGQDAKAQKILDKLSSDMKAYSSMYIEFSAHIKNTDSGVDQKMSGKGWVKGDKYHASLGNNVIISNGIKVWTIVKDEKTVYVTPADEEDEESLNPKKLMSIWENGFKNKYVKEGTYKDKKVHVINLFPKNPGETEYHTIELMINVSDNSLVRVKIKDKTGTTTKYDLNKFEGNPQVSDSQFVFDKRKYSDYGVLED